MGVRPLDCPAVASDLAGCCVKKGCLAGLGETLLLGDEYSLLVAGENNEEGLAAGLS